MGRAAPGDAAPEVGLVHPGRLPGHRRRLPGARGFLRRLLLLEQRDVAGPEPRRGDAGHRVGEHGLARGEPFGQAGRARAKERDPHVAEHHRDRDRRIRLGTIDPRARCGPVGASGQ